MASIIEEYNYDIFISYRQKDNKGDRWVSEFVETLKTELESTFKEEISIYFDINPNDYLLESYDVDASLKKKLKCLIFIPIISRTYCDPKSFAWDHEFKAFIEQASQDQFGLKVTLPNGNVATRVLPIRIHDLDPDDMKLCESVTGGFLRGVEFIYKEPGVNRPLKPDDDEKINLNKTKYRNQINKVALAVKDIIESMKFPITHDQGKEKEIQVKEKKEKKDIKIEEPVGKEIVKIGQGAGIEKIELKKENGFRLLRKSGILIPGILATIIILGGLFYFLNRHSKIKWAKGKAMPEIEQLINKENFADAFILVQKAEKYISKEPKFQELSSLANCKLTILADPPDADVYIREYSNTEGEWKKLGRTPIDSAKIPGSSLDQASLYYLTRIEKTGYEDVLAVTSTTRDTLYRKLFKQGTIPPGMVYVEGYKEEVRGDFYKQKHGFFIDRYEVTNKQYKEFVDKGGYSNVDYWRNEFKKDGKNISRDEAMTFFIDNSGRPGPATWEGGDYLEGQDNYPVSGISWYEAAAYAEYAGKSLPTSDHWESGAGSYYYQSYRFWSKIAPISNFNKKGPDPSGKNQGVTGFGAYDMAGNVREWCWNETPAGHIIRGGAWNDASYLYFQSSQLPSFDRSSKNGFRCVQYLNKEKIPENAFQQIEYKERKDFSKDKPVPENIFTIYKNQFLYDSTDLNAVIEERDNSHEDWKIEKITFNAAYGKERVIAYLFLPKNSSPPFQTLVYFPGINAIYERDLIKSGSTTWFIDYLLKSGRAVMCPVYKGTFERFDETVTLRGHQGTEWVIKWVKDFRRSIDYLETRPDIDTSKLGFYGHSWGGIMGGIIPAVEGRLAVNILICGGFWEEALPEVSGLNYVSRVKIPTLMLNGKYDYTFPLDNNAKPFFNLLGSPKKDKIQRVYDTDHYVTKSDIIKEALDWLDKYFGPAKFKNH
jgi:eukaryotic-like serine/threonine-protein kinase